MRNFLVNVAIFLCFIVIALGSITIAKAGTVIEGWPDVIVCNQPTYGKMVFTILAASSTYTGGTEQTFYGAVFPVAGIQQDIYFNSATGNVDGNNEGEASDCDTDGSISAIIAAGRAYDFGYSTTTVISTTTSTYIYVDSSTTTSSVDQLEQNLWNALYAFIAIVFMVLWLGRRQS